MTDNEAFDFLKTVQPLPDDIALSKELIERYDEVRKHFVDFPNELAVPLLLNSFGNGDGFGVYQLVEDAISGVNPDKVVTHLANALASPSASVRYWAAQISSNYDNANLIDSLVHLLSDESSDTRMAALISLEKYIDNNMHSVIRELRSAESNNEIVQLYDDILESQDV